jgi:thioredoxin reductase (NADPH)
MLSLRPKRSTMDKYDVLIIGSGPAGLTAAIYAARADLKTAVIAGSVPGGQLTWTTEVENFPGFSDGIMGPELMLNMEKQAKRFGVDFINAEVTQVSLEKAPFNVTTSLGTYTARSIIIATGASARWLGVEGEERLKGKGISACATCDGFFFKGKDVIVVGGGDSAMEEATFLTKFASSVTVVHRDAELNASKVMQKRAIDNPKISMVFNSEIVKFNGDEKLQSVTLNNRATNVKEDKKIDGVFVAIGHTPNTELFKNQIELGKGGYIVAINETETSVEGVYVAGDVSDYKYRQAITAAGAGCKAAIDAERYLDSEQ